LEYLLLDVRSGEVVAQRWPQMDRPIPVGSLMKPFLALAYGETLAQGSFPTMRCRGKVDGCWRAEGHGSLGLEPALAQSCNAYFLSLAGKVAGTGALERVSGAFGLPAPPAMVRSGAPNADPAGTWAREAIGLTPEWRVAPLALARAYARLARETPSPAATRVLAGMRLAALPGGTAARLGKHAEPLLAKTGTAPCVADADSGLCLASGDGLVVVLYPAEAPRLLLMVRERGTTGAATAAVAGEMLSQIEAIHGPAR
jgi:cell division protein FtsI/penicillin-binding protein 2